MKFLNLVVFWRSVFLKHEADNTLGQNNTIHEIRFLLRVPVMHINTCLTWEHGLSNNVWGNKVLTFPLSSLFLMWWKAVTFVRVLSCKAGESWMLVEKWVCNYSSITDRLDTQLFLQGWLSCSPSTEPILKPLIKTAFSVRCILFFVYFGIHCEWPISCYLFTMSSIYKMWSSHFYISFLGIFTFQFMHVWGSLQVKGAKENLAWTSSFLLFCSLSFSASFCNILSLKIYIYHHLILKPCLTCYWSEMQIKFFMFAF